MKIRRDHENRYRLRKRMQREDMKMIHMATNAKCPGGRLDPYGAQWVEKIFREDIYDAIPETGGARSLSQTIRSLGLTKIADSFFRGKK